MKIAVTYENEEIFQHFGHTEQFKLYEISGNKAVSSEIIDTNGTGHEALADLLTELKTDILICGGIGGGAKAALEKVNIKLYGGCTGNADQAVENFLNGTLNYNPDIKCTHHEHNEEGGHSCGEHKPQFTALKNTSKLIK